MIARLLVCGAALGGTALAFPVGANARVVDTAAAMPASCSSTAGASMTIIDGLNVCGSEADLSGTATAYGIGGIGYAKAIAGATAIGIGLDGGVGASQGEGGMPAALGIGPDSVAIASVSHGALSVAIAANRSQALVADADQGVICQGVTALALNAQAGRVCFATPVGIWSYR